MNYAIDFLKEKLADFRNALEPGGALDGLAMRVARGLVVDAERDVEAAIAMLEGVPTPQKKGGGEKAPAPISEPGTNPGTPVAKKRGRPKKEKTPSVPPPSSERQVTISAHVNGGPPLDVDGDGADLASGDDG